MEENSLEGHGIINLDTMLYEYELCSGLTNEENIKLFNTPVIVKYRI